MKQSTRILFAGMNSWNLNHTARGMPKHDALAGYWIGAEHMHECAVGTIIGQGKEFIPGPLQKYTNDWFTCPRWKRELFGIAWSLILA